MRRARTAHAAQYMVRMATSVVLPDLGRSTSPWTVSMLGRCLMALQGYSGTIVRLPLEKQRLVHRHERGTFRVHQQRQGWGNWLDAGIG